MAVLVHPTLLPAPQHTHTHTRSPRRGAPGVFLGHAAGGEGLQEDAGEQPLSVELSAPRPTAPCPAPPPRVPALGCPWRARKGCPGRQHPLPGSLWGGVSERGRERVEHKTGRSPSLAKAPRRPGCSFPQSCCPDAWDRGGAGRGQRWAVAVCPPGTRPGGPPLPSRPRLTQPSAAGETEGVSPSPPGPWQFPPPLPVTLSSPPPNDFTFPKDPLRLSGPPRGPPPEIRSVCRGRGAPRGTNPFSERHFEQQSAKLRKTSPPLFFALRSK